MTNRKPSDHGIVVDHKEAPVRYAILDEMYDAKIHKYIRDLNFGETVLGYQPKATPVAAGEDTPPTPEETPSTTSTTTTK